MDDRAERRWIRTDTVLLTAGLLVLAWLIGDVLLLVFAAVLLAVGLDGLAVGLARRTPLTRGWGVAVVAIAVLVVLTATGAMTAPQLVRQLGELQENLVDFVERAQAWLMDVGADDLMNEMGENGREMLGTAQDMMGQVAAWGMTTFGAITSLIVLIVLAMFLAADPALYRRGFLKLVPPARRATVDETLSRIAYALRWWFLGQLVSMALLGVTVSLGLLAVGVDLWLALGVLTALLTFIPFLGPLIAMVPIVVVGFAEGVETGIIVTIGYLVIQNVEGNVLVPMIQHKAVDLAPALLIAVQVLLSLVFGVLGLILAAPLTVVAMVAVQHLWVEEALGERS